MKILANASYLAALLAAATLLAACDVGSGGSPTTTSAAQVAADRNKAPRYTLIDIGTLGGDETFLNDVGGDGWITGYSAKADNFHAAFLWRDGRMIELPSLYGDQSEGRGVNAAGVVAGVTSNPAGVAVGFIGKNGTVAELPYLPTGVGAFAVDVNILEQTVGYSGAIDTRTGDPVTHATMWVNRVPIDLGVLDGGIYSEAIKITDDGRVLGFSDTALERGSFKAFTWYKGVMTPLGTLGGMYSFPNAINRHGHVVGSAQTESGDMHAFFWNGKRMIDLGTLGGSFSEALALNDDDVVVGNSTTPSGAGRAFVWRNGRMTDLGTLGGTFTESNAIAINSDGLIVGTSADVPASDMRPVVWRNGKIFELPRYPSGPNFAEPRFVTEQGLIIGRSAILLDPVQFIIVDRTLVWKPAPDDASVTANTPVVAVRSQAASVVAVAKSQIERARTMRRPGANMPHPNRTSAGARAQ